MATVEEKSMVPTVLVGVGGTGAEVLSRVRRLVEATYGNLRNFPIVSFLLVDTDRDYKVSDPEAAGSAFRDNERYWASVSGKTVRDIVSNMEDYPWINSWFPKELEKNIGSLEAGAGQIRACGRFAFFCNYGGIQRAFREACSRIKGKQDFMLSRHDIRVVSNSINVFMVGSLSGGTGSGMLIDMGYGVRRWLQGEGSPFVTAIMPLPDAFSGISVGDRVKANGYAALMELSYYCDHRTEYISQYSTSLGDEVRSKLPPFDFTYLISTKNGDSDFSLSQVREMIAQNIFLDLTSDFAPHKRSIRDNIKGAWANPDPGGRGYPKNFMSFGLSTIEIPISQIRMSLGSRLAQDLVGWWLNESVQLPPNTMELVRSDILKRMRLTEAEILADLSAADDRSYLSVISEWVNQSLRDEIATENLLQCTSQGVNMFGSESGKILQLVDGFLKPKVEEYRSLHVRELSPDERLHGDYLQKMYDNRNKLIQQGRKSLEQELYRILADRTQGPKFADAFIVAARRVFEDAAEKFRREQDKVWAPNETNRQRQYEAALQEINEFKDKFGISKQSKMEEYCESALSGLEGSLIATIQRKSRALGLEVIARLQEHLNVLERRYNRFTQRLIQARDYYKQRSDDQAKKADALVINGIKLFDRQELNDLYQDLIEQLGGATEGAQSLFELGLNAICSTMSEDILKQASPLWKETRTASEVMQLFDLTEIPEVKEEDLREVISDRAQETIDLAPTSSKLKRELAACDRLFKQYNDESEIVENIRIAYKKSNPLIIFDRAVLMDKTTGFTPPVNTNVAVLGGRNSSDPAAQKFLPKLEEFIGSNDAIKPLGDPERHRIIFVQETGGFSLRCIDGMKELRQSYQDWKGESIEAQRAKLRGENRDLPIPVHTQKEPPFWDFFPENPEILKLVVHARALEVLRWEENQRTKEHVIRYTRKTVIGEENVDIASTWEEAPQVLEVLACRPDREEIQTQVQQKLDAAETPEQKYALYHKLTAYLDRRAEDLAKDGGKDSPEYKREATILSDVITKCRLAPPGATDVAPVSTPATENPSPSPQPTEPSPVSSVDQSSNGAVTQPTGSEPQPGTTPAATATAATPQSGSLEELKTLAELKEKGFLTDAEFEAAKKRILGL